VHDVPGKEAAVYTHGHAAEDRDGRLAKPPIGDGVVDNVLPEAVTVRAQRDTTAAEVVQNGDGPAGVAPALKVVAAAEAEGLVVGEVAAQDQDGGDALQEARATGACAPRDHALSYRWESFSVLAGG
jgi:hypothetical protein